MVPILIRAYFTKIKHFCCENPRMPGKMGDIFIEGEVSRRPDLNKQPAGFYWIVE
jgi:hypothetical protein